jgi:hypothetical protein
MRFACCYRHTINILITCNTYWISMITMVTRTHPSVILCVLYITCIVFNSYCWAKSLKFVFNVSVSDMTHMNSVLKQTNNDVHNCVETRFTIKIRLRIFISALTILSDHESVRFRDWTWAIEIFSRVWRNYIITQFEPFINCGGDDCQNRNSSC